MKNLLHKLVPLTDKQRKEMVDSLNNRTKEENDLLLQYIEDTGVELKDEKK